MLDEGLQEEFGPILGYLHRIVTLDWCYRWKLQDLGEQLRVRGRQYLLVEITALLSMDDEVVLKLCSLDDDDSEFSFRGAAKALRKRGGLSARDDSRLNDLLKRYREKLGPVKSGARNKRIAHANAPDLPTIDHLPPPGLHVERIKHALALADLLFGRHVVYSFHIGSAEPELNLRAPFDGA